MTETVEKKTEYYLDLEIDPEYREYCREFDRGLEERYRSKSEEIRSHLAPYLDLETAHLLDLGCGRGAYGRLLVGSEGRVTGLDVNLTELSLAAESASDKLRYVLGNGYSLPFPDSSFDLVLCRHTLEHLSRPVDFLQEIYRVTRESGLCYLSTPNLFAATSILSMADGRKWLLKKMTGRDRGVHQIYSLGSLRREAESAGFDRIETLPLPVRTVGEAWVQRIRPTLKTVLLKSKPNPNTPSI